MYQDYEMTFTQTGASPNMTALDQAVTVTASGLNFVDYARVAKNIGSGSPIQILLTCTESFATLTSLDVDVIVNDAANAASASTLSSLNLPVAELTAGSEWTVTLPAKSPRYAVSGDRQFLGVNFTVNGSTATAGKLRAAVTVDPQTNG